MNMFNKILFLICAGMLSFSTLAADYTFSGRIDQITNKKVVMSDGTVLKMPIYRPESTVTIMIDGRKNALATLTGVGYVDKAAITIGSDNVVKKIVVLEMNQ